jgi:plastocyanin
MQKSSYLVSLAGLAFVATLAACGGSAGNGACCGGVSPPSSGGGAAPPPATVAPTGPATVAPTGPATVAPTSPATVAPTSPATAAPTGVGSLSIGVALPTTGIGVEMDPTWGQVAGYTQSTNSQVLAFPVGTTITIKNRDNTVHTMNVIGTPSGPPANFPANPPLSIAPIGGTNLAAGYASGNVMPGASVSVTLSTAGTFLIGCAYHYLSNNMRDVLQVSNSATPGPQATPPPSGGGGCVGPYC